VPLAINLKSFRPLELLSITFYTVTGLTLLGFLPLTGFPPHLGFLGILGLITAYSLFAKRGWAEWLVASLLIINTVFSLDILFSIGLSNLLVALSMVAFAGLTWVITVYTVLKRKTKL
jgi:hypothetical protein